MQRINVTYEQLKKFMDKKKLRSQDRLIKKVKRILDKHGIMSIQRVARLIKKVKRILDKHGIMSIQRVAYLDYAKELHKKWWNFKDESLNKEVRFVFLKWNERGLNKEILIKITKLLNLKVSKIGYLPKDNNLNIHVKCEKYERN